jgi:coenzyme F420-reducing hydrogenase delta subunit
LHSKSQKELALGVGGFVGNKGGLLVQFSLYERTFSFINCHLTHGAKSTQERLDMMAEILKKVNPKITRNSHRTETDSLSDFNYIIGDLNSRFNRTYTEHIAEV